MLCDAALHLVRKQYSSRHPGTISKVQQQQCILMNDKTCSLGIPSPPWSLQLVTNSGLPELHWHTCLDAG